MTVADGSTQNVSITVKDSIVDIAGNELITETDATQEVDTVNPTVVISDNQAGTAFDDANTVTYTLTFAENVQSVTAGDIDVTGAALDTNGDAIYSVAHTAETASATVTVTVADGSTDNVEITVNDSIVDIAGNPLITATHDTQQVDTLNPTSGTIDIVALIALRLRVRLELTRLLLPQNDVDPGTIHVEMRGSEYRALSDIEQSYIELLIQRLAQRR